MRALLRRVPDGLKAALNSLAARPQGERERVMKELARGLGKDVLPLMRAAALSSQSELALSAVRTLPVFGTRAAGDVIVAAYQAAPEGELARVAWEAAEALQARGIHVDIPEPSAPAEALHYSLRETHVSSPDGVGSQSVIARLQDQYGVWYAVFVLCNDQVGVKDGFMRPFSRGEWAERQQRMDDRGLFHVQCPPDYARWQVGQARQRNAVSSFPLGDTLKEWDTYVGPPPDGYVPPDPVEPLRSASAEQVAEWIRDSQDLFEERDMRSWFLEVADCMAWARRWLDLQQRVRFRGTSEALEREAIELVQNATNDLISPTLREQYRHRLEDLSRYYEWRGQPVLARRAAGAVLAIDRGEPPAEVPFFIALVQRTLSVGEVMIQTGENPARSRYRPMRRYQS